MLGDDRVVAYTYFISYMYTVVEDGVSRSRADNCETEFDEPLTFLRIKELEREWEKEIPNAKELRVIFYRPTTETTANWLVGRITRSVY